MAEPAPRRPLILTAPSTERKGPKFYEYFILLSEPYLDCVTAAGGLPVVLPCDPDPALVKEYVTRCDGLYLTGGDDIDPDLYAKDLPDNLRKTATGIDRLRDKLEILLLEETLRQRKPVLAICRGHQIANVALGGSLIVDIPQQVKTTLNHGVQVNRDLHVHNVRAESGSLLERVMGRAEFPVNSTHHQAVDRVAERLRVTAHCVEDGVPEALEMKPGPDGTPPPYFLAVQFHPERLVKADPAYLAIFNSFVEACRAGAKAQGA